MKKILSVLIAAICLTACAFSFTACGDKTPEHTTHNWSTTYTPDEMLIDGVLVEVSDRHYQTCDGCDEKKYSNHDYGTSGVCVCGKHKPETPVTGVTLDTNTLTLEIGGTATLTATIAPENATDKTVTWESDKTNIATVDNNGKVTAIKDGTAIITAKTANGKTATCTVTVNAAVIPVESVTLNKTEITLEIGGTETLTASVAPENATDKTVTWTVAPAGVVSVENDVVTAIKDGTATITATTANGKTATCSVTVNAPLTNAQVLQFLNDNVLMKAARGVYAESGWDINETNIKNATWHVTKDGKNITGANLVFTYERRDTAHYVTLCNVEFTNPLTPQNIRDKEIGTPTYSQIYTKAVNPTIQEQHTALTNAICNKLFGESTISTRYIIYKGSDALSGLDYDSVMYSAIEISDKSIKEHNIKIGFGKGESNDDSVLIRNLNNPTKYSVYGDPKNIAIIGDRLEENDEPFDFSTHKTPLGDKVTNEQLKTVLNAGYREKAILWNSVYATADNVFDERWFANKDKYGNMISATLFFKCTSGTKTYACKQKITFCTAPFAYEDYLNAENEIYHEAAFDEKSEELIKDTATADSHSSLVTAVLNKLNVTLTATAQVSHVDLTNKGNPQSNINGEMVDVYYCYIYILDGDMITHIQVNIKSATSDAGFISNLNAGIYVVRNNRTYSLLPDGEKL